MTMLFCTLSFDFTGILLCILHKTKIMSSQTLPHFLGSCHNFYSQILHQLLKSCQSKYLNVVCVVVMVVV